MRMALSAWVNQKRPENVTPDNGIIVPDFFIVASEFAWFMSTRNKKELREEVGKSSRRRGEGEEEEEVEKEEEEG